ncbi:MAG TPA: hypothetical protein VH302_09060 [Bryobacteraceae bacterium]|nr:hypothetical protein [Bryobacteraceae bacterium]
MRTVVNTLAAALAVLVVGLPLLGGALTLQIDNPAANPEALSKHAVLVARTTACVSPEKTSLTATAEALIDGQWRSIPLKLIPLSTPGTFAVVHEWPAEGAWAVKIVARNPDYKDYATGALVRFDAGSVEWASIKHYFHEPTKSEVTAMLDTRSGADRASLK